MTVFWCQFGFRKCLGVSWSNHWAAHHWVSYKIQFLSHVTIRSRNGLFYASPQWPVTVDIFSRDGCPLACLIFEVFVQIFFPLKIELYVLLLFYFLYKSKIFLVFWVSTYIWEWACQFLEKSCWYPGWSCTVFLGYFGENAVLIVMNFLSMNMLYLFIYVLFSLSNVS